MPNRPILIGAAVLLLAAAACMCAPTLAGEPGAPKTDANPPAPAAPADPPPSTGAFTPGPCPFEFGAYDIDCGTLTVPERHANPDGPTLELAVAILRSPNPAPDPIVYLAGGPGGSAIWEVDIWLATPYVQTRDVILIDQRGTGFSSPTLNCPEEEEGQSNAVDRCYRRLRSEGIDLAAFNSAESAADVEMLRQALGIAEWNVVGVSYGTRLALTLMRDHGAAGGIRSVVLDSPYPPEVDAYTEQGVNTLRAFDVLLDGCAADPACSAAYPDLRETFYRLLVELEDNPVDFTAYDPEYDETIDYTLTGYDLLSEVFLAMYNTGDIPYLPKMIADIDRGDYTLIGDLYLGYWLGDSYIDLVDDVFFPDEDISDSEGFFYSVECYEEEPFSDLAASLDLMAAYPPDIVELAQYDAEDFDFTCRTWDVGAAGSIEDQPVVSDIPTLILAGEYDPVTPPVWGEVAERSLTNDLLLIFPGVGHAAIDSGPCPESIVLDFLAAGSVAGLDTSCMAGMGPPAFVTD